MTQEVYEEDGFLVIKGAKNNPAVNYDLEIRTLKTVEQFTSPTTGETYNWSRTISDLLSKKWVEKTSLYKVAQITDSNFPNHLINWSQTFKMVERLLYYKAIDKYEESKGPEHEGLAKDIHADMMSALYRAIEEDKNKDVQISLDKAVEDNLTKYNLRTSKKTTGMKTKTENKYIDMLFSITGNKYTFAQGAHRRWGAKGKIIEGRFYQLMPESANDPFFRWYFDERADYQFFKSKANCVIYFLHYWFIWTKNK